MATNPMGAVLRHLRRAASRQDAAGRTDGQLLASFIEEKDEAAFEALVRRHGPMVWGVCRRVVGNHHDAEDAFQATFLVLARKAPSVRPRERVAGWLHGVALRTARKARAGTAKRRGRERQVAEMPEPEAPRQDQWRDLQPLLDRELNGLPGKYRLPILLCDLEDRTIKEAAWQLGWPQGTLAGRLARGRKLLAKRLASRGVVLPAGSLAVIVSQNVASAGVPTSLTSSASKVATLVAAGQAATTGSVPAKVAALSEGVLKAMLFTKLKTAATVLFVSGVAAFGGVVLTHADRGGPQARAEQPNDRTGLERFVGVRAVTPAAERAKETDEKGRPAAKGTAVALGDRNPTGGADELPQDAWRAFCEALRAKDEKALVACSIRADGDLAELRDATIRWAVAEQRMQEIAVARFGRGALALVPDSRRLSFLDQWCKGEGRVEVRVSGDRAVLTITGDTEFNVACRREGGRWRIDYAECESFRQKDPKEIRRVAQDFRKDADGLDAITRGIQANRVRTLGELRSAMATRLPPRVSPDGAE